jgi:hypothetical protein
MLQYDDGRKFGCAGVVGSIVNYCTEAKRVEKLADCSFLKAAITGDAVSIERKNKDEYFYTPQTVFVFATNGDPDYRSAIPAIKSRFAEIPFTKTYSDKPVGNELKADPRYHDDPTFIKTEVAPAFINLLIKELQHVIDHGINYSLANESMDDDRYSNDRIYRYFTDKGIVQVPGGQSSGCFIELNTLWEIYREGLEQDGVDDEQRKRNGKLYCPDRDKFSKWVKTSYPGVDNKQRRIGEARPMVIYGLEYTSFLPSPPRQVDTVSVSAKPLSKTELDNPSQAETATTEKKLSPSLGGLGLSTEVATPEPLPGKDVLGGYAKIQPTAKPAKPKYVDELAALPILYQPGQQVRYLVNGKTYRVAACNHAHVTLEGKEKSVAIDHVELTF